MTMTESLAYNLNMLDKLEAVLESIDYRTDMMILTEGADSSTASTKFGQLMDTAITAIANWFKHAAEVIDEFITNIKVAMRGGEYAIFRKDITVSKYVFNGFKTIESAFVSYDVDKLERLANSIPNSRVTVKQGQKSNISELYTTLKDFKGLCRTWRKGVNKASKTFKTQYNLDKKSYKVNGVYEGQVKEDLNTRRSEENKAIKQFMGYIKSILKPIIKDIGVAIRATGRNNEEYKANRKTEKQNAKVSKAYQNYQKVQNKYNEIESYGGDGMTESAGFTRNEYIASIMLEAANLLREEAGEDDIDKDDSAFEEFDDLPEERPVIMDDYDPDVNGGEGEKLDLEEIEDLCDGDQDVIDLLVDDEDKSVTVDASNESALDFFRLDW